jgi:mannose-1-phosphate guanylyltransferase / mannose-6-phosphate isomerase
MSIITPVIMCGGSGTRLWPLSRAESPKQFQRIDSNFETTFFQATVQRHRGPMYANPVSLVNHKHLGIVSKQLGAIQQGGDIIIEPCSRNTAPALAAAALKLIKDDPEAILLTLPSDHLLSPKFNLIVSNALAAAEEGYIVTFGIKPTYPETGYGYILDGGKLDRHMTVHHVEKFVEKPNIEIATALLAGSQSYWASGIAMYQAKTLIDEFKRHAPDVLECAERALSEGVSDGQNFYLGSEAYAAAPNISCEYAVIEKSARLVLAPADVDWDDVGAWSAFHRIGEKSNAGNVTSGDVLLVDTKNSYVRSEEKLVTIIGLSDIVVVDTADALLIADMSKSQSVKAVVEALNGSNREETVKHRMVSEEWGTRNSLVKGELFALRHVQIDPGHHLEFGVNESRDCNLTIIQGIGEANVDGKTKPLIAGMTLEAAADNIVTVRNTSAKVLHVIEILVEPGIAVPAITIPNLLENLTAVGGAN